MQLPDFFLTFIRRLNLTRCPYMITGAAASIIYGEPRLTNDLDLILDLKKGDVPGFVQAFPLEEFYCPPEDEDRSFLKKRACTFHGCGIELHTPVGKIGV